MKISNTMKVKTENGFEDIKISNIENNYRTIEGEGTDIQTRGGHVQGTFNELPEGEYLHIVGNGTDNENRSNAHTLDKEGNAWFAGDIILGESNNKLTQIDLITKDLTVEYNGLSSEGPGAGAEAFTVKLGFIKEFIDYDAFIITSSYDKDEYSIPFGVNIVPNLKNNEISPINTGYLSVPWGKMTMRTIQIKTSTDLTEDEIAQGISFTIEFRIGPGIIYNTYGGAGTAAKVCFPREVYGIKNINRKNIDTDYIVL